jgi:hypothetical protein
VASADAQLVVPAAPAPDAATAALSPPDAGVVKVAAVDPVKQPMKEPVKRPVEVPVKEPVKEPVTEPVAPSPAKAPPSSKAPATPAPQPTLAKAGGSATPIESSVVKADMDQAPARGRRLGAFFRGDVDGKLRGWAPVLGATFALSPHIELAGAAIVGAKAQALWLGGSYLLGNGKLRPLAFLGVPMFVLPGVHAGVHVGAGAQWDLTPRIGIFMHAGIAHFFSGPGAIVPTVFLPSLGIRARL